MTDRTIEAVIFDWGGTLSRWAQLDLIDVWRLAARRLDPDREDEIAAHLLGIEDAAWAETQTTQRSWTLAQVLERASDDLGLDVNEVVLEEAALHHIDAWTPHIEHKPDAAATLEALRERGLRIGLLSNTMWPRPFHRHFLERDGLLHLIDAEVYSSEIEVTKPHPAAFAAAQAAVGVTDPARAVFVGDRLFDDIHGARAVGMRTVYLPTSDVPGYDVEPDAVIDSLSELPAVIDAWSRGEDLR